ncbi:hypothetical protein [Cellulosimicrobium cellulans]|uniref:hypothetical protein n=1 Tax=Cellulosimicrobium cellulans TaxID=1710 RepID=UPI001BA823E9|nr:hypothetical protein [Cellulosimicrobium cellulans]QUC01100.1 hypothetical protein J5A69_08000 [Cellulosimicrobium cellulans]
MTTTVRHLQTAQEATPALVKDYAFNRRNRNVVHDSVDPDAGTPDVTFRVAESRSGSLTYVCATRADALTLESMHATRGVLELEDDEDDTLNMHYVVNGDVTFDENTPTYVWTVAVPYRQVAS